MPSLVQISISEESTLVASPMKVTFRSSSFFPAGMCSIMVGHIADHLGGMVVIGETIEDRHFGVFGEFGDGGMLEGAAEDRIAHAREDFGGVVHGFAHAEVNFTRLEVERVPAQFGHGDFEGNAGAGGGFFEDHRQRGAFEQFWGATLLVGGFDLAGQFDDVEQFFLGEILRVNEMADGHGRHPFNRGIIEIRQCK